MSDIGAITGLRARRAAEKARVIRESIEAAVRRHGKIRAEISADRERRLATVDRRHRDDTRKLLLHALEKTGWLLTTAASLLGEPPSTIRRMISADEVLSAAWAATPHHRGRPRKNRHPRHRVVHTTPARRRG